ncbi:hypothetical protein Y919_07675 [Caloranaerobacter azorensis H53214]|uniref:S-layer protein C-terminal domain-containing protein n=1 Tax=Caloranaerobacter azorensis H53214 TaxID=1156417 RepID=A0A096BH18_9FIRM|nr:hypothetical protein [Caloranaerobacter azorensis]KGG80177.1 hypothetical protein Y919_07675 [Caloranaerobacter azorensis H53214]
MKKFLVYLLTTIFILSTLTGCGSVTSTDSEKIDKSMTGMKDYSYKVLYGDKVVVVYGTIGSKQDTAVLYNLAKSYGLGFQKEIRDRFIVKSDVEVNEDDIKNRHIIILGNPETNQLFAKINEKLPMKVIDGSLVAGDKVFKDESVIFKYLIPNPLNKKKYLIVNGALNKKYMPYILYVTTPSRNAEYVIKANKNEKYAGLFDKTDTQWLINKIGENLWKDDFKTRESEHFIFHYSSLDDNVEKNINKIIEEREKAYEEISSKLNISYSGKIDYYFFISDTIKRSYRQWDDDFWLGNVYEVYNEEKEDNVYRYYIYKVLINQIGLPLSRFTQLGLYGALDVDSKYNDMKIKDITNSDDYIPLEYLTTGLLIDRTFNRDTVLSEIFSFAKYLVDKYGFDKYIKYYKTNLYEETDKALYSVYKKDLYELEGEWLDYINAVKGEKDEK